MLRRFTAIEKRGDQYQVIIQVSPKYRGSFNTLAFGEIKGRTAVSSGMAALTWSTNKTPINAESRAKTDLQRQVSEALPLCTLCKTRATEMDYLHRGAFVGDPRTRNSRAYQGGDLKLSLVFGAIRGRVFCSFDFFFIARRIVT